MTHLPAPASRRLRRLWRALPLSALLCAGLSGCVPVAVVGGAAGVGAVAVSGDRRSQPARELDDQLQMQGQADVARVLAGRGHVNVHAYRQKVLLTGEVPSEQDRQMVVALARGWPQVLGVFNEVAVMRDSGPWDRSRDAWITSKVRTQLLQQNGVPSAAIKVVTERGVTYLMGALSPHEIEQATQAARQVQGVQRVVRVLDVLDTPATDTSGVFTSGAGTPRDSQGRPLPMYATQAAAPAPTDPMPPAMPAHPPADATGVVTSPVLQPAIAAQAAPAGHMGQGSTPIQVNTLPPMP